MAEVKLHADGGVRHIELSAPDRRNALTLPMLDDLAVAIADVARDADARALVVSAQGKAFCAGADVSSLFGDTTRPPADIRDDLKGVYARFLGLRDLKIPTIAAVNGVAVGAGANIAFACDTIVAGPRAKFVISFADIGLHPGGGCTWFLTDRLGSARAMMAVLDAQSIDAHEALRTGLVSRLVDEPEDDALALATRWAARDPQLTRDMKRAVRLAEGGSFDAVVELESWAQAAAVTRPAFQAYQAKFAR